MKADYYKIKCARFEMGLTQKQLAKKAGISPSAVYYAESGRDISPTTNGAICKALGLERRES